MPTDPARPATLVGDSFLRSLVDLLCWAKSQRPYRKRLLTTGYSAPFCASIILRTGGPSAYEEVTPQAGAVPTGLFIP
jgi:hypothetical protein